MRAGDRQLEDVATADEAVPLVEPLRGLARLAPQERYAAVADRLERGREQRGSDAGSAMALLHRHPAQPPRCGLVIQTFGEERHASNDNATVLVVRREVHGRLVVV